MDSNDQAVVERALSESSDPSEQISELQTESLDLRSRRCPRCSNRAFDHVYATARERDRGVFHVLPLSRGGKHCVENLRIADLAFCQWRKRQYARHRAALRSLDR